MKDKFKPKAEVNETRSLSFFLESNYVFTHFSSSLSSSIHSSVFLRSSTYFPRSHWKVRALAVWSQFQFSTFDFLPRPQPLPLVRHCSPSSTSALLSAGDFPLQVLTKSLPPVFPFCSLPPRLRARSAFSWDGVTLNFPCLGPNVPTIYAAYKIALLLPRIMLVIDKYAEESIWHTFFLFLFKNVCFLV